VATSPEEGTLVVATLRDAPEVLAGVHRSAPARTVTDLCVEA
jgi:hypothetical protein